MENFSQLPKTRDRAIELGLDSYFTGKPCRRGHVEPRRVSDWACRSCAKINKYAWDKKNSNKIKERSAIYRDENRELVRERSRVSMKKRHSDVIAYNALKKARKLQATPPWADREKIKEIYFQSKNIFEKTKVKHHVDHIIPLLSDFVCGLHCEHNLRVIPATDNLKKKNYFWPDMSDTSDVELKQLAKEFWSNPNNVKTFRYSK